MSENESRSRLRVLVGRGVAVDHPQDLAVRRPPGRRRCRGSATARPSRPAAPGRGSRAPCCPGRPAPESRKFESPNLIAYISLWKKPPTPTPPPPAYVVAALRAGRRSGRARRRAPRAPCRRWSSRAALPLAEVDLVLERSGRLLQRVLRRGPGPGPTRSAGSRRSCRRGRWLRERGDHAVAVGVDGVQVRPVLVAGVDPGLVQLASAEHERPVDARRSGSGRRRGPGAPM